MQQENEELSKIVERLRKSSDKLSSAGSSHRRTGKWSLLIDYYYLYNVIQLLVKFLLLQDNRPLR